MRGPPPVLRRSGGHGEAMRVPAHPYTPRTLLQHMRATPTHVCAAAVLVLVDVARTLVWAPDAAHYGREY